MSTHHGAWPVPDALRPLAALAVRYGDTDDGQRTEIVESATTADLRALVAAVEATPDAPWEALVSPAASPLDPEYLRYSALLMAFDLAKTLLRQRTSS